MAATAESQLHAEEGTSKPCTKCKWHTADPTNPFQGQCTVNRTVMGSVWKRWVRDSQNMTCSKYEEGKLSFRDHV